MQKSGFICFAGCLMTLGLPAHASVRIQSISPSSPSPQVLGTSITWAVTATDSSAGPLTFQFNVATPQGALSLARDYNAGNLSNGVWTAPAFVWTPVGLSGIYQIQVIAKDFTSGETSSKIINYQINPLLTGSTPVAVATANPLVALFSAPSCPAGSTMRVSYKPQSQPNPVFQTNWVNCHSPGAMTFEVGGMYAQTTYQMAAQVNTGGTITTGTPITFTTGSLPNGVQLPKFGQVVAPGPQTDTADVVLLHNLLSFTSATNFPGWATDLAGRVLWYYYVPNSTHSNTLTRPLPGGTMLWITDGTAWNPAATSQQYVRQIDLAGNIVRETNTGAIQQQLLAMGATDAQACNVLPSPAPIGAACLGGFHHDFIQTLPNGGLALIADIEKIYPPGAQGDTSNLPVDIIGDMIIVLNSNWQVTWYFDAFEHAAGPPQLDIKRAAVLNETCVAGEGGCPPILLLGPGIAPTAKDWLHANSLYYWPQDGNIIWSSRHQDWVMKVDYRNGAGTGNILWRMGPCGDFSFNNLNNDPWPWFSHQHDVAFENGGTGPMTIFDNGNTRISPSSGPGSSTGCLVGTGTGNSRGMALTVDENAMQATPVLSQDLGGYSIAMGSAQLLGDGNYFFQPAVVFNGLSSVSSYCIQILPTPATVNGTQVFNLQGPESYRGWEMPNLYTPPTT